MKTVDKISDTTTDHVSREYDTSDTKREHVRTESDITQDHIPTEFETNNIKRDHAITE